MTNHGPGAMPVRGCPQGAKQYHNIELNAKQWNTIREELSVPPHSAVGPAQMTIDQWYKTGRLWTRVTIKSGRRKPRQFLLFLNGNYTELET